MKQKTSPYLSLFFILFSLQGMFAQDFSLLLSATDKTERAILKEVDYRSEHKDTISLHLELNRVADYLKNRGYFTNTLLKIEKENKKYVAFFSLNNKIDQVVLTVNFKTEIYFEKTAIENSTVTLPIHKLAATLSGISSRLDKEGKSFSKVQLNNIFIKNKTVFADLKITPSKKRSIHKVILKGYEKFPSSYVKNYFNISPTTLIHKQKIKEITAAAKNLQFITEIKPPEVLFTKDSTMLYLYFKKKQHNRFNGIVSFASTENGDVFFNGNIDIRLHNIFDTGERFELFWNRIGEEKQEFKATTDVPYLFNSKLSPNLSFSIYKQDSTFLNTKFDSKLFYHFNAKIKFAATYTSESSEKLSEVINNNIETYRNYFLGIQFQYRKPKNDFFFNDQFHLSVNPSFGKRKTNTRSLPQFKVEATASYLWDVNARSSIYLRNNTGYLNADSFIDNELFRIGGANSIRGYSEQSIYTNTYSYFNLEYRYLTSEKSYLYTISDIGQAEVNSENENILGLGLGYLFHTKDTQINIGLVAGKNNKKILIRNTQLLINWVSYF